MVSEGVQPQAAREPLPGFTDGPSSHAGRAPVAVHDAPPPPGPCTARRVSYGLRDFHMVKASTAPHFCFWQPAEW